MIETEHGVSFEVTGANHGEIRTAAEAQCRAYFGEQPWEITRIATRSGVEQIGSGIVTWFAEIEAQGTG